MLFDVGYGDYFLLFDVGMQILCAVCCWVWKFFVLFDVGYGDSFLLFDVGMQIFCAV